MSQFLQVSSVPIGALIILDMRVMGLIKNAAVAVKDGKVLDVGSSDDVRRNFDTSQEIDAENRVVCPGFVDPHTHIVYGGDRLDEFELKIQGRDYLDILKGGGGIISTVTQTRAASVEDLFQQSNARLNKMLAWKRSITPPTSAVSDQRLLISQFPPISRFH